MIEWNKPCITPVNMFLQKALSHLLPFNEIKNLNFPKPIPHNNSLTPERTFSGLLPFTWFPPLGIKTSTGWQTQAPCCVIMKVPGLFNADLATF